MAQQRESVPDSVEIRSTPREPVARSDLGIDVDVDRARNAAAPPRHARRFADARFPERRHFQHRPLVSGDHRPRARLGRPLPSSGVPRLRRHTAEPRTARARDPGALRFRRVALGAAVGDVPSAPHLAEAENWWSNGPVRRCRRVAPSTTTSRSTAGTCVTRCRATPTTRAPSSARRPVTGSSPWSATPTDRGRARAGLGALLRGPAVDAPRGRRRARARGRSRIPTAPASRR